MTTDSTDPLLAWYPESQFGGFTDVDGTVLFYARLQALVTPESVVLDVGCGRGRQAEDAVAFRRELRRFRGKVQQVIGIDVDPIGAENPFIDTFRLIGADGRFPVDSESCDLVFSDYVVEHVADPTRFFAECHRVLRPGGILAIRTTNANGYVARVARLLPVGFHIPLLKRAQAGEREPGDMFVPVYACNTEGQLKRALEAAGFDAVVYPVESEPRYFRFSRAMYALAVAHQRWAPRGMKLALFAFARRV